MSPLVSSDLIMFSSQLAVQLKLIKTSWITSIFARKKKIQSQSNQVTATRVSSYRVVINKLNSNVVCILLYGVNELTTVNKQFINIIIIGT